MEHVIIDNFLKNDDFLKLQNLFLGPWIPWYFNNSVARKGETSHFQFVHVFYDDLIPKSSFFNDIYPIIEIINPKALIRIKANLGTKTIVNEQTGFHNDVLNFTCKTAILYLNTNDGYTEFEDGTKIKSVENRFVEFDSTIKHTGVTQTDTQTRVLLNFNYVR